MKLIPSLLVAVSCLAAGQAASAADAAKAPFELFADKLDYQGTQRLALFSGNVVVKDPSGMEITCQLLRVNFAAGGTNQVEKIFAEGGVVIVLQDPDGRKTARGREATYHGATDTLELTGDPVVESDLGTLTGAKRIILERSKNQFLALDGRIHLVPSAKALPKDGLLGPSRKAAPPASGRP